MVQRTIEMREIGFPIPKARRKKVIEKITSIYKGEFEVVEEGSLVWVKGDLHNRFKRERILFILSGGKLGQNI